MDAIIVKLGRYETFESLKTRNSFEIKSVYVNLYASIEAQKMDPPDTVLFLLSQLKGTDLLHVILGLLESSADVVRFGRVCNYFYITARSFLESDSLAEAWLRLYHPKRIPQTYKGGISTRDYYLLLSQSPKESIRVLIKKCIAISSPVAVSICNYMDIYHPYTREQFYILVLAESDNEKTALKRFKQHWGNPPRSGLYYIQPPPEIFNLKVLVEMCIEFKYLRLLRRIYRQWPNRIAINRIVVLYLLKSLDPEKELLSLYKRALHNWKNTSDNRSLIDEATLNALAWPENLKVLQALLEWTSFLNCGRLFELIGHQAVTSELLSRILSSYSSFSQDNLDDMIYDLCRIEAYDQIPKLRWHRIPSCRSVPPETLAFLRARRSS